MGSELILNLILGFILGFVIGGWSMISIQNKEVKTGFIKQDSKIYKVTEIEKELE